MDIEADELPKWGSRSEWLYSEKTPRLLTAEILHPISTTILLLSITTLKILYMTGTWPQRRSFADIDRKDFRCLFCNDHASSIILEITLLQLSVKIRLCVKTRAWRIELRAHRVLWLTGSIYYRFTSFFFFPSFAAKCILIYQKIKMKTSLQCCCSRV
jgi:hypothetical protein